jgi:hypothetical protein
MHLSENEGNSEAKGNAGNATAASVVQTPAVAWDSVRAYGQIMTRELLLSINHRWATWFAGATFAKRGRDPFGSEQLTMTLAPDLDPNDESVRYLVKLSMLDAVECLVAPELAQRLDPELGGIAWQTEKRDNLDVAI